MRVLVVSPDTDFEAFLRRQLPAGFEVTGVPPGAGVLSAARRERPQIAVIDRVNARSGAAILEAAILREARPEVRIIAVSRRPSMRDAGVVTQGVFFYLSAPSAMRLVEVIEAAGRAIESAESDRLTRRELA